MITLEITPLRFIAAGGKLDSDFEYIFESLTPVYLFAHPVGRTISVQSGGVQYNIDSYSFRAGTGSSFQSSFLKMVV